MLSTNFLFLVLLCFGMTSVAQHNTPENFNLQLWQSSIQEAEGLEKRVLQDSLAELLVNASDHYIQQKNYKDAIPLIHEAISLFKLKRDQQRLSDCYSRLGASYYRVSDYEKSQLFYFKSLNIEEEFGNTRGIAVNLEKIGEIYLLTGDLDKADSNFEEALELYRTLNDEKGIIFNLTNLGASSQKSGNWEKAISLYKDGLARANKMDLKRSQSILLGNIGSTNRSLGNYQESLEYLFRALDLKLELKRYGSAAHSCSDIAETYMKLKEYNKAKTYALRAVELAKNENLNEEKFAYYLLSEINYVLGDYKASYLNLDLYNQLRDSLFAIQKIARINEMQIKYETEKKQMMIAAQENDIALLNEKSKVKNQYIVLGALGSLTVFGFILLVRSKNREKQKKFMQMQFSRDLLTSQETERTRIAKDLHDSIGQQLTLIKRKAQHDSMDDLAQLTSNTLEEVRSISRALYPAMLKQLGLTASIEQLIYDYDEQTQLFITQDICQIDAYFNEEHQLILYRFVQEVLNNIVKHANASAITFNLNKQEDTVYLEISDNGVGFNVQKQFKKASLGLKTLRERIKMLNGQLQIKSEPEKGTSVFAVIPIHL